MKTLLKTLATIGLLLLGSQAQALIITPDNCGTTIPCASGIAGNSNSQAVISAWITSTYPTLTEVYKQDVGAASDVGTLAGSYTTTFGVVPGDDPLDPGSANIAYGSGSFLDCITEDCFLLVKDGNHSPASYWFNLTYLWDGMETLELRDFWPNQGAISHVSLYGSTLTTTVPEPSILSLLAISLLGMFAARRKIRQL